MSCCFIFVALCGIVAVNANSVHESPGQVRWQASITTPTGSDSWAWPAWYDNVLVGSKAVFMYVDTNISAWAADDGAQLWSKPIPGASDPAYTKTGFVLSTDEKTVFGTITKDSGVVALNAATGVILWQKSAIYSVMQFSVTPDSKTLFVAAQGSSGKLYAIEASTGNVTWTHTASNSFFHVPALSKKPISPFGEQVLYAKACSGSGSAALSLAGTQLFPLTTRQGCAQPRLSRDETTLFVGGSAFRADNGTFKFDLAYGVGELTTLSRDGSKLFGPGFTTFSESALHLRSLFRPLSSCNLLSCLLSLSATFLD